MSVQNALKRPLTIGLLALGLILGAPTSVLADDLDDISIQVIGLDEIPEDALERIPMPSPNFSGLTDIRHNIIPHQSPTNITPPIEGDTSIVAPVTEGGDGSQAPK